VNKYFSEIFQVDSICPPDPVRLEEKIMQMKTINPAAEIAAETTTPTPIPTSLAGAKNVVSQVAAEAREFHQVLDGSVTDKITDWVTVHALIDGKEGVSRATDAERSKVLHGFVRDWVALRRGDHQAARLELERSRVDLTKRNLEEKWKTKIYAGIDGLLEDAKKNPRLAAAITNVRQVIDETAEPEKADIFKWLKNPEHRREMVIELTSSLPPETSQRVRQDLGVPSSPATAS
jgi:hypothetical protein